MHNTKTLLLSVAASLMLIGPALADRWAGIEIGAKGIKAVTVEARVMPRALDFLTPANEVKVKYTINTTLADTVVKGGRHFFRDEAIEETVDAVKVHFDALKALDVPAGNIFIVTSSSVPGAANFDKLASAIKEATKRDVKALNIHHEVGLSVLGTIKADDLADSILIDVGSGNVKVGYFTPKSEESPGWLSLIRRGDLPGTVKYANLVSEHLASGKSDAFVPAARELRKTAIVDPLKDATRRHPLFVNHQRAYVSGGIAWALVTIMKPEAVNDSTVTFRVEDVEAFHRKVTAKPAEFPSVDFSKVRPSDKKAAEKMVARVKGVFTPEQLVAGAEILKGAAEAFTMDRKPGGKERVLVFTRDSQYSWLTAYVLLSSAKP